MTQAVQCGWSGLLQRFMVGGFGSLASGEAYGILTRGGAPYSSKGKIFCQKAFLQRLRRPYQAPGRAVSSRAPPPGVRSRIAVTLSG
jgi:hypothetical protein